MSNYVLLKQAIDAVIKANGRAEITGSIMNQTLVAMVNSLGKGYQFVGIATPAMNPNTPDEKVFYLATESGTYNNFDGLVLRAGLNVLTWDGTWHNAMVFAASDTPNHDSSELMTSGGVYNALKIDGGAYDVSAHFPTGGVGGGNTYTLTNAITKVPVNMRKGGMSIKFIDATTNKYVKHTFLNPTTDGFANVNNWQGIIESAAGFHTLGDAKNHQLASVGALVEEFGIKCVNELPTASASTMNKIYSIPTAHPVAGKRRDEYFTVETGIAPDYTDVKDLVTVTAIPDNALGAQVGEGKFIANDTTNNKAYYFTSVHAQNEWGYEVTVEEVTNGKVARMINLTQYITSNGMWVEDFHYADYTWESLSPDLSSLATKSEVAEIANALDMIVPALENMTNVEYSDLVAMRDNGDLVPGKWYRITDYRTNSAQEDTQSAYHQFDVIVRADAANKLNENAFAAIHYNDTYFTNAGAKLEAWQLKYCLDNDTDRFAWADANQGRGVIYWMRDEWGNECPYDFKNIMFKRYKVEDCQDAPSLEGQYCAVGVDNVKVDTDVIFWAYTFSMYDVNENLMYDTSVFQEKYRNEEGGYGKTMNNIIHNNYESVIHRCIIPNNVFMTDTELCAIEEGYGEFDGYNNNILSNGCTYNTFGNNCLRNIFENSIRNVFGGFAMDNRLNGSTDSFFGNACKANIFKGNCSFNRMGDSCKNNIFGDECAYNVLGANSTENIFGNLCENNTLGEQNIGNIFGNNCRINHLQNNCKYNIFENSCYAIYFDKDYTDNVVVESGVERIELTTLPGLTPSSKNPLSFIKITQGVNNTGVVKVITVTGLGQGRQLIYKAQGSQEIEV